MTNEIFKHIQDFPNYKVSNYGNVMGKFGRLLKPQENEKGYLRVNLRNDGVSRKLTIHRLVGMTFIPTLDGGNEINHMDGNKTNNKCSNLEWCSRKHNVKHAMENLNMWGSEQKINKSNSMKGTQYARKLSDGDITNIIELLQGIIQYRGKWGFSDKLQVIANSYNMHIESIRTILKVNFKKSPRVTAPIL